MNAFGNIFRVSIFGESHGEQIGVVVDGLAPGIPLSEADFTADIARRRSGAKGTTPRVEADEPQILSGVYDGYTTGAPLAIVFHNTNTKSQDYEALLNVPRPGHADYTANLKYGGFQDPRGGGHFSGRLTLPVVAAGVIAKKLLFATIAGATRGRVQFRCDARLVEIGGIADPAQWDAALDQAQKEGDSLGGVVECVVSGVPAGLGEPFWDSVESRLSHALFAIPGVRGVDCHEHGEGEGCCHGGEEHDHEGGCCHEGEGHHEGGCCGHHRNRLVTPATNHAGGVNGGITNGNPLVFRVAFKPTPVIVEAMAAIVLADLVGMA